MYDVYIFALHSVRRIFITQQLTMQGQNRRICAENSALECSDSGVNSGNQYEVCDSDDNWCTVDEMVSDTALRDIVDRCWSVIDQQSYTHVQETSHAYRGWKTIRVFVSSTFSDMHSEREVLIKKVWCF